MAGTSDFPFRRELDAFEAHRGELLGRAAGKYALVHGDDVAGVFDTEADGICEGYRRFGNVPFLVKRIDAVDVPEYVPASVVAAQVPVLSWTAPDLRERGPLVPVTVAQVQSAREAMLASRQQVPAPVTVSGLIDTGSARTAIDQDIASRLGLRPSGVTLISTPSNAGADPVLTYAVRLAMPGSGGGVTFDVVTVVEARLADQGIGVLIGRDVLASAVLVYVGQSGQCTISFQPTAPCRPAESCPAQWEVPAIA